MSNSGAYLRFIDDSNCILTYVDGDNTDIVDWAEMCLITEKKGWDWIEINCFSEDELDFTFLGLPKIKVYSKGRVMDMFTRCYGSKTTKHEAFLHLQLFKQGYFDHLGFTDVYTKRYPYTKSHYNWHYLNKLTIDIPLYSYGFDNCVFAELPLEKFMCLDIGKIKKQFSWHEDFIYFVTNTIGWRKEPMSEKRINDFLLSSIHKYAYEQQKDLFKRKPKTNVVKGKLV
jgi:hypothetical protein